MNIYIELTHAFNVSGLNAILSSGQAVVIHRLAIMSKDGDLPRRGDRLGGRLACGVERDRWYAVASRTPDRRRARRGSFAV